MPTRKLGADDDMDMIDETTAEGLARGAKTVSTIWKKTKKIIPSPPSPSFPSPSPPAFTASVAYRCQLCGQGFRDYDISVVKVHHKSGWVTLSLNNFFCSAFGVKLSYNVLISCPSPGPYPIPISAFFGDAPSNMQEVWGATFADRQKPTHDEFVARSVGIFTNKSDMSDLLANSSRFCLSYSLCVHYIYIWFLRSYKFPNHP